MEKMIKNDASLRGKIKALAAKHGLRPQEVLQMYLFEHLLMRLSASGHSGEFVLKGGLLIASMTGIAQRTTMDMDTTVVGMDMDEETIVRTVSDVCGADVDDGMEYCLERVEPIREDDEYSNWRAHIRVRYGRIDAPIKVDITTGDAITPRQIEYMYPLMFGGGTLPVMSYPLATILAEKFETVVRRGISNTRGRDFYDIHVLLRLYARELDPGQLKEALAATADKRGSAQLMPGYAEILSEVSSSPAQARIWKSYVSSNRYAEGISLEEAVASAAELGDVIFGR